jgi:flavin reductase (DIM6/NTAB) family NADH-FMN oxidoreductase RutF
LTAVSAGPIERQSFVDVMAELPAAVAVITTRRDDRPTGLAVTSFSPYSADPPSVMVSVGHHARSYDPLLAEERFGAHLLSGDQEALALRFASRAEDKFDGLDWDWHGDVPRLNGTAAFLLCHKRCALTHGDHTVLIGEVRDLETAEGAEPLVFLRRRYRWRLVEDLEAS